MHAITEQLLLSIVLAPLLGSIIAGLWGRRLGNSLSHWVTIIGVSIAFFASLWVAYLVISEGHYYNAMVYQWLSVGELGFEIGFLVDGLTAVMLVVVTFVSLMVHIYTIGYMREDSSYSRFFSYISLFTFSMLMLVLANNFMQLFFAWEAVGLVSYLLIGFWYKKPTAIYANLKAFLVNRVGDFGFILGIAGVLFYAGSLDYVTVFEKRDVIASQTMSLFPDSSWSAMTVICLLLFVGAMGKSAQVPLHVWLPDSMEGPTPISALIHAATMVTAGIFMVSRMSPLFELSETALATIMMIGAITALSMGILGLVQNDIKRVIAYSTLSQLGYMTAALGVSAYSAAIFHLMTHAFFKALLFLAAGAVIMALHHQQDMRKMGGLRKALPITYWTSLIGSLALIGFPGFSGFFSKDTIIEAVKASSVAGSEIVYIMLLIGVFITALYSFRLFFMVFHGQARFEGAMPKEPGPVVVVPLLLLAIPAVLSGLLIEYMLYSDLFTQAIQVLPTHDVIASLGYSGLFDFIIHGVTTLPFWLAISGVAISYYLYIIRPTLPAKIYHTLRVVHPVFNHQYGFDKFNSIILAGGARQLGKQLSQTGDKSLIDGLLVNGTAKAVAFIGQQSRRIQSGYLYHYAFAMIIGLWLLLTFFVD